MNLLTKIWTWLFGKKATAPTQEEPKKANNSVPEADLPKTSGISLNTSEQIHKNIRNEFNREQFLRELKSSQPFEKQFDPLKKEFSNTIKKQNPQKPKDS